jgi:UDP-N-acetyl-alpha-D-quinovosamine dehydrogenase
MIAPGKVLVTGASGFVGGAALKRLFRDGWEVRGSTRHEATRFQPGIESVFVPGMGSDIDWTAALVGVTAIVHCAARVHVLKDVAPDPLAEFRRINTAGTLNLARHAAKAGVRRLVFLSSIGVNGAETFGTPFSAEDRPNPDSPYAFSKHEAETGLREISAKTGLEIVIVRPPLVFGPNAPGNFRRLLRAVEKGIPLPLGAIRNRRSFVALDNLIDLLAVCLRHPSASGQVFLVSDGDDLSTTDLLRRLAAAMGKTLRLIPIPADLLRATLQVLGRPELAQRLCGSLEVDIKKTREVVGWAPKVSVDDALRETVIDYFHRRG